MANTSKAQELDLEALGERLQEKRRQILDMYQHDVKAGKEATDEGSDDLVDRANNAYNRELLFSLSGAERETLRLVDGALARLEKGDFGDCRNCGDEIGTARLEAVPWARYCIDCQELAEQGLLDEVEGAN